MGVHVLEAGARSVLDQVRFEGLMRFKEEQPRSADVSFHRSPVTISHAVFGGAGTTLLALSEGEAQLRHSTFHGGSDQLEAVHAAVQATGLRFLGAGDDAVSVHGGGGSFTELVIDGAKGEGVKATALAQVELTNATLTRCGTGIEAREGSSVRMNVGRIEATQAAHAGKDEVRNGPVRIELKGVEVPEGAGFKTGQGSSITHNGRAVGAAKAAEGT
jgi:hypothetical protein